MVGLQLSGDVLTFWVKVDLEFLARAVLPLPFIDAIFCYGA